MGWLIVGLVLVALLLSLRISIYSYGTWFSPLTHYLTRWGFLVFLFQLNLIGYSPISWITWGIIILSIMAFFLGSIVSMLAEHPNKEVNPNHVRSALCFTVCSSKYRQGIIALFSCGFAFFIVYLKNMPGSPNPLEALSVLSEIRAAMKEETIPGFHYFYFMELVVFLCFLHYLLWRRQTPFWVGFVGIFALGSLLYTTGKVNIAKALVWCFFCLLYLELYKLTSFRVIKWVAWMIVGGGCIFSALVFNESSDLSGFGDEKYASLLLAYLYMSVPVGVLDKLIADPSVNPVYGAYTFAPVLKIFNLMGADIYVPSHIGEFYLTPVPANIATYLDLMYKDFGYFGFIFIPFFLGFLCSYLFHRLRDNHVSLFIFSVNTILALSVFGSTGAANYMKPSYWFQIFAIYLLSVYSRKHRVF